PAPIDKLERRICVSCRLLKKTLREAVSRRKRLPHKARSLLLVGEACNPSICVIASLLPPRSRKPPTAVSPPPALYPESGSKFWSPAWRLVESHDDAPPESAPYVYAPLACGPRFSLAQNALRYSGRVHAPTPGNRHTPMAPNTGCLAKTH